MAGRGRLENKYGGGRSTRVGACGRVKEILIYRKDRGGEGERERKREREKMNYYNVAI